MTDTPATPKVVDLKALLEQMRKIADTDLKKLGKTFGSDVWKAQEEARLNTEIERIDAALKRIENKEFGVCVACGDSIDADQLEKLPHIPECEKCMNAEFPPGVSEDLKDRLDDGGEKPGPKGILERLTDRLKEEAEDLDEEPTVDELQKDFMKAASEDPGDEWTAPPSANGSIAASDITAGDLEGAGARDFVDDPLPDDKRKHGGEVRSLPVEQVLPAADNDRKELDEEYVKELAENIRSLGLINRITVVPTGEEKFTIIAGHCRFAAIKVLGWEEVPVEVFHLGEADVALFRLSENVQRKDLSPIEEARALESLVKVHGFSQRNLAQKIGRSQSHISKRLSLVELPEKAVAWIDSGRITLEEAAELNKLSEHPKRLRALVDDINLDDDYPDDITSMVEADLHEIKQEAKLKAVETELKEAGVTSISSSDFHKVHHNSRAEIGKRPGQLDVDRKKHVGEPCHRAIIDSYSAKAKPVCIDVKRHRSRAGESEVKGTIVPYPTGPQLPGMSTEEKELRKDLADEQKRRHAFIKAKVMTSKKAATEGAALMVAAMAWPERWQELTVDPEEICRWLDIKVPKGRSYQTNYAGTALKAHDDKHPEDRPRYILVAVIEFYEDLIQAPTNQWQKTDPWGPDVKPYFDFLERHGYELSETERNHITPPEEEKPKTKTTRARKSTARTARRKSA